MTGKGNFTRKPGKQLRWMVAAQLFWILAILALGAWWGFLVLRQAERISELEAQIGLSAARIESQWHSTQRMLFWESSAFFFLLIVSSVFLFRLYWREHQRGRAMQAFFASVTHELRTPLTSIRLQAESIADGLVGDEKRSKLVTRLLEDTERLENQVERVLELARVEGGGPLFTQPLRLRLYLDRVVSSWAEPHREHIEVRTDLPEVAVEADPTAVQVIFKNLLENSLRHAKKEKVSVSISARQVGPSVRVTFKDDGAGFRGDASRLGTIFEKGPGSSGAGVGLYLIRVLMERMGGRAEFTGHHGFEARLDFRAREEGDV